MRFFEEDNNYDIVVNFRHSVPNKIFLFGQNFNVTYELDALTPSAYFFSCSVIFLLTSRLFCLNNSKLIWVYWNSSLKRLIRKIEYF